MPAPYTRTQAASALRLNGVSTGVRSAGLRHRVSILVHRDAGADVTRVVVNGSSTTAGPEQRVIGHTTPRGSTAVCPSCSLPRPPEDAPLPSRPLGPDGVGPSSRPSAYVLIPVGGAGGSRTTMGGETGRAPGIRSDPPNRHSTSPCRSRAALGASNPRHPSRHSVSPTSW